MIKNLKRAQRALLREGLEEEAAKYDFSPTTYVLPTDYGLFVEELKTQEPRPLTLTPTLTLTLAPTLALTLTRSSRTRRRAPSGS